ncbi:MAG: penicillin-binding transpeptidase domain-containing protein [Gaiellales bacterium]
MRRAPRRSRRRSRALVVGLLLAAAAAAAAGVLIYRLVTSPASAAPPPPDPRVTARAFIGAWQSGDVRAMYRLLDRDSRRAERFPAFLAAYRREAAAATLLDVRAAGPVSVVTGGARVVLVARTRLFGPLRVEWLLPLSREGDGYRVRWGAQLTFPGLLAGEHLVRRVRVPAGRGRILSRERIALAEGSADARRYPQGAPFAIVTGYVRDPQTAADIARRRAEGWPPHAAYGQGGLEKSLDSILAGSPTFELVAARPGSARTLAVHPGHLPHDVVTTLSASLQVAATDALGNRYGGIVVIDTRSGAVRADAGIGMDALQPPGSSFKTVTASALLSTGRAALTDTFPAVRFVEISGFKLRNFHHELCGGTLVEAFAHSCNSVFAPLADRLGPKLMAKFAGLFGFNRRPSIAYPAPTSVTPSQASMSTPLQLGTVGIGQGGVDASPLQMASVAQVLASGGVLEPPWLARLPAGHTDRQPSRRVLGPGAVEKVGEMMRAVVSYGTGTAAAIPGVTVAGKTGTAELGPKIRTDAWFICYAPAEAPRVAVAVMVVHGGVGGETAAPIARQVVEAALQER